MNTIRPYECAKCGGHFETDASDEDQTEEFKSLFSLPVEGTLRLDSLPEDCSVVCDDCWQLMMGVS